MVNPGKVRFFANANLWMASNLPENTQKEWAEEYDLTDCKTCGDQECPHRLKESRYPPDAAGRSQCIRLAQSKSKFAFRNVDGTVIILPESLVEAIRNDP